MNTIGNYNLENTHYRFLPANHVKTLERFLEHGIHPGDFMERVLENNLVGAVAHADEVSKQYLCSLVMFISNHLPGRFLKPGCVEAFMNDTIRYTVAETGYCDWVETDPIKAKYIQNEKTLKI
jgi:hypothetical protein